MAALRGHWVPPVAAWPEVSWAQGPEQRNAPLPIHEGIEGPAPPPLPSIAIQLDGGVQGCMYCIV